MEDSRRTAVMFMHRSWRRKNKEKKRKGKGIGGEEVGAGRLGLRRVALAASWAVARKHVTGERGGGQSGINPAFRRLYAWRLWLLADCVVEETRM